MSRRMQTSNYIDALKYAREQLTSKGGLPLTMRLLNETLRLLMLGVRGASDNFVVNSQGLPPTRTATGSLIAIVRVTQSASTPAAVEIEAPPVPIIEE